MRITWLASYPRSGNTWLRFLLANYLFGEVRQSLEVEKRIPNIHRRSLLGIPGGVRLLCKTHYLFSEHHPQYEHTQGSIYLLRSPKDVLISNYYYSTMTGRTSLGARAFAKEFIRHQGVPMWRSAGVGSWLEHVRSWLCNQRMPLLVLRYEEMISTPHQALARAARFLDVEVDNERIAAATAASCFERMREIEEHEKLAGEPTLFMPAASVGKNDASFVREGRFGQALGSFGADLDSEFDEAFNPFLNELQESLSVLERPA